MTEVPSILQRKPSAERVVTRMVAFVETYEENMGDIGIL